MSRNPHPSAAIEARLALRLTGGLSARSETLPHDIAERLRVAREQALARAREARRVALASAQASAPMTAPAFDTVVVGADGAAALGGFSSFDELPRWLQRAVSLLPLLVLVGGLIAIDRWSAREQMLAAAEIDSQLLADTLPPDAYSDPGFAEFLRTAPNP